MPGFIRRIKLGHLTVKFIFRHQWDDPTDWSNAFEYKTRELGLFFRKDMCVGTRRNGMDMFKKDNLSPSYMFGLRLIWAKCWLEFSWKVKHFEI